VPGKGAAVGVLTGVDDIGLHEQADDREHGAVHDEHRGGGPSKEDHKPAGRNAGQNRRQAETGCRELEQHTQPDDDGQREAAGPALSLQGTSPRCPAPRCCLAPTQR